MKQNPAKLKYKKYHRVNYNFSYLVEKKIFFPTLGTAGIQALEFGKLTYRQIEACRRTLRRGLQKTGKIFIRIFTGVPVTKKSIASRMGKGKGATSLWIAPIRKGQILFEITETNLTKANIVLSKAIMQLPIKAKIVFLNY